MSEFRSPAFAKLTKKVERAHNELGKLTKHTVERRLAILSDDWAAMSAAAAGVHNIYDGIEDILSNVARDVDGSVPDGSSAHQDLLDQMAVPIPDVRKPLISDAMHRDLTELKGFRHLVRHRYGIELSGSKVLDNVERVQRMFPLFVEALFELERELLTEASDQVEIPRPGED